jgi:hypothetical protein
MWLVLPAVTGCKDMGARGSKAAAPDLSFAKRETTHLHSALVGALEERGALTILEPWGMRNARHFPPLARSRRSLGTYEAKQDSCRSKAVLRVLPRTERSGAAI